MTLPQFKIENLPSGSEFKVNVFARNDKGISDKTEVICMMMITSLLMMKAMTDDGETVTNCIYVNLQMCISPAQGSILDNARGNGDWGEEGGAQPVQGAGRNGSTQGSYRPIRFLAPTISSSET